MRRMNPSHFIACGVLAGGIWAGLAARPDVQSAATAFVGVSALPMDKEAVLADQTVIVREGKIVSIGPAAKTQIPAGASRIDGRGKFLMPGLAEMHAHIPAGQAPDSAVERTLFLYAANGITTIRGMLGDPRHLTYRERAARGEIVSPLIYTSGPSFNAKMCSTRSRRRPTSSRFPLPAMCRQRSASCGRSRQSTRASTTSMASSKR
jgi:hypothetical protein